MIMNEDVMGPEFSLTVSGIMPEEFAALRKQVEQQPESSADECSDFKKEVANSFMEKICASTDGFLFKTSLPPGSFRCEQESDPHVSFYDDGSSPRYVLFWSLNVCFEGKLYDDVSRIVYSDDFEASLVKAAVTIFIDMLSEKCPFLSVETVSAEVDGIGET